MTVTPCSIVSGYQCFRGICRLNFKGVSCLPKTLVTAYNTASCRNSGKYSQHFHYDKNQTCNVINIGFFSVNAVYEDKASKVFWKMCVLH